MPAASLAAVARDAEPAPNPTPMRRSHVDEEEVTGKAPVVAESPRVQAAPPIVPAKSAPKIAAAPPVVRHVEPEPAPVVAQAAPPVAEVFEAPAPVLAHAAPAIEERIHEMHKIPEPTPLGPPYKEAPVTDEIARAKTPSPEPVAVVRAKAPEPKVVEATPVVTDAQALLVDQPAPSRGRQFLVATLLILWILAVAAVVGLFFTGRLPMP
ncbi:MAG: hypothetical protein ABIP39_02750 [Polyangiaceae bacterium]